METLKNKQIELPSMLHREYTLNEEAYFAVVGDMHLNCSTPKSRIDDYPQTLLDKLSVLRRTMIEKNCKYLICLGDIFHRFKQPTEYEFRVIQEFLKFKQDGIKVFTIVGNHDIAFDRIDTIQKTSLGLLFLTDVINPFTKITFTGSRKTVIYGVNFPMDIPEISDFNTYNICVAHKFYEYSYDKESITAQDVKKNSFSMYLLGHDHVPYDLKEVDGDNGKVRIIRPGAFSRGTAHDYNTTRMVYTDFVRIDTKINVDRVVLDVKDPKQVFTVSVLDKVGEKADIAKMSVQLADLVSKLYEKSSKGTSVYSVLDSLKVDSKVKSRIEFYLESVGIFRQ